MLRSAFAVVLLCISISSAQTVEIDLVAVGNPSNPDDIHGEGYGGVDYEYNIGKFEITAGQYAKFLNAVAATDTYGLYSSQMDASGQGCKITQNGTSGSFTYDFSGRGSGTEADWLDRPVNYVSWPAAARFCNWLHNGQPIGAQDLSTTEDGSYYMNGATGEAELMAITREPDATWVIPSEDEWYKAAYHYNNGVTGDYYDYPTSGDNFPGHTLVDPDPGNRATLWDRWDWTYTIGPPFYRTIVGEHENSSSPYGTFDQGGNITEWLEDPRSTQSRVYRGGSFDDDFASLHADARSGSGVFFDIWFLGFRVAKVEPAAIPAVSEWGLAAMTLLVLIGGTLLITRRRPVPA